MFSFKYTVNMYKINSDTYAFMCNLRFRILKYLAQRLQQNVNLVLNSNESHKNAKFCMQI